MPNDFILRQEELVENPTARLPVCLVLDVSGSMAGEPIRELQSGVETFFAAVLEDEVAQYSAEVAIVTFGGTVDLALDFASIQRQQIPSLKATGSTPMGKAIEQALRVLEARKAEYKNAGVDYFQPWLVLMTDGSPTDDIAKAKGLINDQVNGKKLAVFAIGIGNGADMSTLATLSGGRAAMKLKGLSFQEFFVWLSASVSRVSQSTPGDKVSLDTSAMSSWASV